MEKLSRKEIQIGQARISYKISNEVYKTILQTITIFEIWLETRIVFVNVYNTGTIKIKNIQIKNLSKEYLKYLSKNKKRIRVKG